MDTVRGICNFVLWPVFFFYIEAKLMKHKLLSPFWSVQFSGIQSTHGVGQPPLPSSSSTFSSPGKETPYPGTAHTPPWQPFICSVPLNISYQWNYTMCGLGLLFDFYLFGKFFCGSDYLLMGDRLHQLYKTRKVAEGDICSALRVLTV